MTGILCYESDRKRMKSTTYAYGRLIKKYQVSLDLIDDLNLQLSSECIRRQKASDENVVLNGLLRTLKYRKIKHFFLENYHH